MITDLEKFIKEVTTTYPNLLAEIKEIANYLDHENDKGIVNRESGSSVTVRANGDVNMASSIISQSKLNGQNGYEIDICIQSVLKAVRRSLDIDEIVINKHKLNPDLYELCDMRTVGNNTIGNLTLNSTVLVKAWEPTLKKWVLIRRPARTQPFSPLLNLPDAPPNLDINTDISEEILKFTERRE